MSARIKKGISSTELSRKLGLRQKTCWKFKIKAMKAMESSGNHKINGNAEVDETVVGGQKEGVTERKSTKKKLVVFTIEHSGKEVSRMYGKVIQKSRSKELGGFMKTTIALDEQIKTDKWRVYAPLAKDFKNSVPVDSGKKVGNFPDLCWCIIGFDGWLRRMHHQVDNLEAYIDEYC